MNIEEYYKKIAEKKAVPDFASVSVEFGLDEIKECYTPRKIAENIAEKIKAYVEFLEQYIQADGTSISAITELKGMNEKDRDSLSNIYKELMIIEREFLICDLKNNPDGFGKFITETIMKWNSTKPELIRIIEKAKQAWKDNTEVEERLGYME